MAKLIENSSFVGAWLDACAYLKNQPEHKALNLILEIDAPETVSEGDRAILIEYDNLLRQKTPQRSLSTVANTIFPQSIYRRYGRPGFYKRYLDSFKIAHDKGAWGSYAQRMMYRVGTDGKSINPLDTIVEKLRNQIPGHTYASAYELGIMEPTIDLAFAAEPLDIPTYDPATDANRLRGGPCLSHLSFKLLDQATVHLVAVYRSHYYLDRAPGNLLGLSQLLSFVAKETNFTPGTLTCISTYAYLDVSAIGGMNHLDKLLASRVD